MFLLIINLIYIILFDYLIEFKSLMDQNLA